MEIYEKIQEAGLTRNEARVYLELIKKGELTANQIARNISMDRTLTYTVLNHLIEKGQVSYVIKENKKFFSINPIENLLNSIKAKEILITDLITELSKIEKEKQEETEIKVLEGKEGIRTLVKLALKHKTFDSFGSTGAIYFNLYEMPVMAKQAEKLKMGVRIIGNKKYRDSPPFSVRKFQYKYLNIDSKATTSIFGDYVSIHLAKNRPKALIILIKNPEIAKSYKNHFKYLWKKAKP